MAEAGNRFALILLDSDEPPAVPELYGRLAGLLGRVRYDVIGAFKRSPGIPFDDLDAGPAEEAVRALAEAGVRSAAVPAERLPELPKVFTVHSAGLPAGGGLSIRTDYVGSMQEVSCEQIAALSAASMTETTGTAASSGPSVGQQVAGAAMGMAAGLAFGVPLVHGRRGQPHKAPAPRVETIHVLAVSVFSVPLELRFKQNALNYEFLGEFKTPQAVQNLRILACELLQRAPRARVSPAFRELAENGVPPPAKDTREFICHNRWLKLLATEGME